MGAFKWDILNPDRLVNLEINNKRRTSIFNPEIKEEVVKEVIYICH